MTTTVWKKTRPASTAVSEEAPAEAMKRYREVYNIREDGHSRARGEIELLHTDTHAAQGCQTASILRCAPLDPVQFTCTVCSRYEEES